MDTPSAVTAASEHISDTPRASLAQLQFLPNLPRRVTLVTGGVQMGSGVLLAALVVLWFVVLVPMVVTRDGQGRRTADSGRTLQRRRAVDPVVHADTERVSIDRDALRVSGELKVDVHRLRRRVLGGLVAVALLTLLGAIELGGWLWVPQVVLDLAVVGYVL